MSVIDVLIVRDGLISMLNKISDVKISGEASTDKEAIELCIQKKPDLIFIDADMSEMDNIKD